MFVRELMTAEVWSCRPNQSLDDAARMMWEHDCGAVPVTDDENRIVGMITDRDICMAAHTQGRRLQEIQISSAMSEKVFSCHADDSLETAERLMGGRQIHRVPVVDDADHPIGVLTINDIARHAAKQRSRNGLEREVTATLAAIGRPRAIVRRGTTALA